MFRRKEPPPEILVLLLEPGDLQDRQVAGLVALEDAAGVDAGEARALDDTAAVAKTFGVTVLERNEPTLRGKSHALDFARKLVPQDSPLPAALPSDLIAIMDSATAAGVNAASKSFAVELRGNCAKKDAARPVSDLLKALGTHTGIVWTCVQNAAKTALQSVKATRRTQPARQQPMP